jgi:hypothetical protein
MHGDSNGKVRGKSVWFIETKWFTATWSELRLSVDDLIIMQDLIKVDPTRYPVIRGTGGLRKMRFAPPSSGRGKRGALRVCYAYFDRFEAIVLVLVYPKNEMADLSPAEKKAVKKLLAQIGQEFEKRFGS